MEQDLRNVLDELESLVDDAGHIPLTGKIILDADKVYDLIDRLRGSWPEAMQQAQKVIRERDRLVAQAREESEAMVKEAQAYAEKLTRESAIVQRAEEEAGRILDEAHRANREMRMGAREYADEILEKLEANLQKCMGIVRQGREDLGPGRVLATEEEHE